MNDPGVLTEAEYKNMFRKLYKDQGLEVCLQIVHELLTTAKWMYQIIDEENKE